MALDRNIIFEDKTKLFVKSEEDGLYVMPWRLLNDGYEVTKQETVVRVDADAGIPITHSRFTAGGRIISAKIFVDQEPIFWLWYARATRDSALPCWIYDVKVDGFMRCYITDQPSLAPAGDSVEGVYVQLKLYAKPQSINALSLIVDDENNSYDLEGKYNKYICDYSFGEERY